MVTAKRAGELHIPHTVDDDFIVEWRALTVALLDRLHDLVRQDLKLTRDQFPLAKMLEAGILDETERIR